MLKEVVMNIILLSNEVSTIYKSVARTIKFCSVQLINKIGIMYL